jgi:hypothetical protein
MSSFLLFSFGPSDFMMGGTAVFAMLCGIILLGGRSVVVRPLKIFSSLFVRGEPRDGQVCLQLQPAQKEDVASRPSMQHAA